MSRALRLLRASLLPALALAGIALFAWGVVGWWSFHRALFVEEVAAIEALAGDVGAVEYRRQGETTPHEFDATKQNREDVPWSVPFVGRAEFVRATRREFGDLHSQPIRDRLLRLPGLRGYVDAETSYQHGWFPEIEVPTEDLPFGRRLPTLPEESIPFEKLIEPIPKGESLPEDEVHPLARQIALAWRKETSARSRLERVEVTMGNREYNYENKFWRLVLDDDPRRIEFGSSGVPRRLHWGDSHLFLRTEEAIYAARSEPDGWRMEAVCNSGVPEARSPKRSATHRPEIEDPAWFVSDPHELPILDFGRQRASDLLGPEGEQVARIERIDDDRLRIETEPWQDPMDSGRTIRLTAVVRSDLDFGIELYEAIERDADYGSATVYAGAAKLDRAGGEAVVTESLYADWFVDRTSDGTVRPSFFDDYVRERIATEFDPAYSEELFDPRSYERDLPEARELPAYRTYRVLMATGGACLLLAACGSVVAGLSRRSFRRPAGETTTRKRFSLQFGFATLLAFALLVISAAGWVKQRLDEARDQNALLASLSQEDVSFQVEREKPGFPWMFVSTDALPLDAPLRRIAVRPPVGSAATEKLLRDGADVEYAVDASKQYYEPRYSNDDPSFYDQVDALGGAVPEFPALNWLDDTYARALRPGVQLEGDEREAIIKEAIDAWRKAPAKRPTAYLVREKVDAGPAEYERLTIRDGDLVRNGDFATTAWVECLDARYRRRFAIAGGDWHLVLRRPLDEESKLAVLDAEGVADVRDELTRDGERGALNGSEAPTERAMTDARLPRAPYCLPPCVADWKWTAPLDEALATVRADDIAAVARIDDRRVRFELHYRHPASDEAAVDPPAEPSLEWPLVVSWSVVARSDLDWAVERCEYVDEVMAETAPVTVRFGPGGSLERRSYYRGRHRRELQSFHTLVRREGNVAFDGASFIYRESALDKVRKTTVGTAHYAVDLSPEFPGPIFDRAMVDSPDPPLPVTKSALPWYFVTGTLAITMLLLLGARRTMGSRGRPLQTPA